MMFAAKAGGGASTITVSTLSSKESELVAVPKVIYHSYNHNQGLIDPMGSTSPCYN